MLQSPQIMNQKPENNFRIKIKIYLKILNNFTNNYPINTSFQVFQ